MWMPNMKNINVIEEEDNNVEETWELTRSTMVTNWPPRSYTCSFCRREFRSAQALGGHMNVHRRDRARLNHQAQAQAQSCYPTAGSKPILYQLGNCRNLGHGGGSLPTNSSRVINYDEVRVNDMSQEVINKLNHEKQGPNNNEELDLELRLGHISTPTSL